MKYWLQVEDKSAMTKDTYKFQNDVDTHAGISMYTVVNPPVAGYKYDSGMKKFVALTAMELSTAYTAWSNDQKKPFPNRKWVLLRGWPQYESPGDDTLPPWPGPFP